MKGKISVLIALSALFILCFGMNVFAYSESYYHYIVCTKDEYKGLKREYRSEPGTCGMISFKNGSSNTTSDVTILFYSSESFIVKSTFDDSTTTIKSVYDATRNIYYATDVWGTKYWDFSSFDYYSNSNNLTTGQILDKIIDDSIKNDNDYIPNNSEEFSEDTATKNTDLGYLKLVSYSSLTNYTATENKTDAWRITWENKSTTSFDLTKENCYVEVQGKMKYFVYKNIFSKKVTKTYKTSSDSFTDLDRISSSLLKFEYSNEITSEGDPLFSQWKELQGKIGLFDTGSYATDFRARILYKGDSGWTYGPWLTSTTDSPTDNYTSEDEDGNQDDTPANVINVDDDGNETVVDDGSDGGMTTFIAVINSIKSSIGEVPALIGEFFTFIPASIVALIAVGFALAVILRIIGR